MAEYQLADLPFIDIYVRLDADDRSYYRAFTRGQNRMNQFVPEEFAPAVKRFQQAVIASLHDNDGSMDFEGVRCRLSKQKMSDETSWVCARRINTVLPQLDKLGFAPHIYQHMAGLGTREGLIMISGATGQGKTTTAVALLTHFMRTYGGTAVTIEDPVEYTMKGRHGEHGHCFQVEAKSDEDWAVCLKRALRWAPRYIYVGEIRTPKAAEQLLRAATTGHTVITTVHAGALEEAIMGLLFLAEQAMGPGCSNIFAASLTALVYQTMKEEGPFIRYLFTEENSPGDPIRALIRENKIGMISTYVDRIAARLTNPTYNGPAAASGAAPAAAKTLPTIDPTKLPPLPPTQTGKKA
jgi:twitching motility protein PilT